ncbi:hypothetical protein E2562_024332 [Oryza meyeriana var. granulata]|uniref:Calmodulin-binding protein-like n=1 Tax=Oryza meyeriana var. granulata TaxID=110450 RepID=A0A6G1C8F9_9ORYZ|nr:hypothetical protein E2562_024332 [Oryza meyeriana var. granulata]
MAAAATPDADHAAAIPCDPLAAGLDSACSTPFVSAPSSPSRDHHHFSPHGACFFSAPASPTRGDGGGAGKEFGVLDFDFDFSSRFPSPSAAAMSSADELFHNGQIRHVRLSSILLQPQPLPPLVDGDHASQPAAEDAAGVGDGAEADERGRIRSRSVRRKARSMSPFRTHWRAPSPAPAPESVEPIATPAASRSSSSSSTASSTSSTSSRGSRRWAFLKDLLHRSKSDGGKNHHHHDTAPPPPQSSSAAPKRSPSPSPSASPSPAATARGGRGTGRSRRRSAHERLYEARRAEAEEMRRRTYLPYRQGLLLFGCIGLGSRGYGAVHGLARGLNAAAAVSSRS